MAKIYPICGNQYDITLFEFGSALKYDCGYLINLNKKYF